MDTTVTLKSLDETTAVVAGYGVVFGDRDLEGDTFDAATDLALDYVPTKRVFYDHRRDGEVTAPIGQVLETKRDEVGLWVEAQLDRSRKYVDAVLELVQRGALGWSSGSIPHMVDRAGGTLKAWPVVEFSLTPTPAEPRTLGVRRLKALLAEHPSLQALVPEAAMSEMVAADAGNVGTQVSTIDVSHIEGASTMTEEIKAQDAPQVDVAAIARQAAEEAVKAYRAQLEAEPPAVKGAALTNPATPKAQPETFKSLGDELQAVARWSMNGTTDRRLDALKATGLGEDINSQAGFLVQTDFAGGLLQNMHESGAILSRVRRIPISAGSNGLKLNAVDESSRANGSRWGGVAAYWAAEAGTATASKPKFRQMNLELNKLLAFCYATDELLADSTALESVISQAFAEEMTYKVEDAVIRGTGAGQPLGILNNSSVYVSVAKETGQDADTFTYDNAVKMWSRMWAPSRRNAVWFINQDVEPQLYSMTLAAGTAGVPVYMPAGGISGAPYGTLFGRPVIAIEQADTVGDLGDVMLLDLSQYLMIDKGGLQAASSLHVMFLYAEQVFRFIYRTDGQPAWNSSLTPANSSNTLSPFVLLDARA